jgi:hypothetical protein
VPPHPLSMAGAGVVQPLLASLTFENTDGSVATPSESYVTFGMAFKKGDIPSGSIPDVRVAGVPIPAQFDLRNTWSDGSLRWCEVSCIAPSIAGGGTLAVKIHRTLGSYDNTQTRDITDITGNTDFTVNLTAATDYLSSSYEGGTLEASFNDAVAGVELIKSGPVCDQWRCWAPFETQTNDHLAAYFYVTAWTKDSDGTLGPISHIARVHNGYIALTSPTKYHYDASYKDGVSTIRQFDSDQTFTVASQTLDTITCTAHGVQSGTPVTVVSDTTLPAGLSAATVYYARAVDANTLTLHTSGTGSQGNTSRVNITSNGTGTHTLELRVFHPNQTYWWTCGAEARPDWTADEATIHVAQDIPYLLSTGMLPPYDQSISVTPSTLAETPLNYAPFTNGPLTSYRLDHDGTGGTEMIGYLPSWAARAVLTQEQSYVRDTRVKAYILSSIPYAILNEATGKVPTARGSSSIGDSGDYTGLGTNHKSTWFFSTGNNGINGVSSSWPTVNGGKGAWNFSTTDWSHTPEGIYYTALTDGGAHLLDAQLIFANNAVFQVNATTGTGYGSFTRTQRKDSGSSYNYGLVIWSRQTRSTAWSMRSISNAAALVPDAWVEKPYFDDLIAGNAAYAVNGILGTYITGEGLNTGAWTRTGATQEWESGWMHNWVAAVLAGAYKIHEGTDLLAWVDHLKLHCTGFADGTWPCALGSNNYRYTYLTAKGTPPTWAAWDDIGVWNLHTLVANAGTDFITATDTGSGQWTISNDDKIRFPEIGTGLGAQTLPGNITANTWYYVVNKTGSTFQLSATLAGSAIDITSNGGTCDASWRPASCPMTQVNSNPDTYLPIAVSALCYLEAAGIADVSGARAALEAYQVANFTTNPVWALQASF